MGKNKKLFAHFKNVFLLSFSLSRAIVILKYLINYCYILLLELEVTASGILSRQKYIFTMLD